MAGKGVPPTYGMKLSQKYRDDYGMDFSTSGLAALMYQEHPEVFRDKEHARYHLRYIEGKTGKRCREYLNKETKKNTLCLKTGHQADLLSQSQTGRI